MNELLINLSVVFSKPTGISNYATNLFSYLKHLQPTLLTSSEYPNFNCKLIPNNLTPAQGTKGHFNRLLWTQFKLPQIYRELNSKLLFSPQPEAPLYTNCRYIVTVHDVIPLRFPTRLSPLTYYHRYYIPKVLAKAQHIICNSNATAKDICDFYGIKANKITSIPLAHDPNNFSLLAEVIRNNNNNHIPPYFLYVGRHDFHKNLHGIIAAFAQLKQQLKNYQDYQLWFAGSSDNRHTPRLHSQIEELGIQHQVKFLDYVTYQKLPQIIHQAIALVFPSLWEGFGFPVLEAMACGTPVITSNLSSLPEVAGDAALLVNPYHINEIAEAMMLIATDDKLRSQLAIEGCNQASKFSWEKTGQATAEVLKKYL
ncbi:MAG: glycosyltransferase family 1 protein [Cyanobacteriota bacterium]|nr:glycosyltransferase family 1 protein [Cyanobacteriota bacterium]